MRRFRSHTRWGAGLALFSLLVQLAVSCGHVHAHELAARPFLAVTYAGQERGPSPDNEHSDHQDRFCDICAVLYALGSAQIASPLSLALQPALVSAPPPVRDHIAAAEQRRPAFQSRAPPTA